MSDKYVNILKFYNKLFIATSIQHRELKKKTIKDTHILINIKKTSKHLQNNTVSFMEKIAGATIIIEISKIIFTIKGCFRKDPLNIIRLEGDLKEKNNNIIKELETLDVPKDFKEKYIQQLSLRDFVVSNSSEILNTIHKS